jgi:hypothetical protein
VTREGRVLCRVLDAQAGQGRCRAELRLRDILPNGRARRSFSPVCAARILLMPDTRQDAATKCEAFREARRDSALAAADKAKMQDAFLLWKWNKTLAPLPPDAAPVSASASAALAGQECLRNFYERHTGLGPGFRLLTELDALEEKRLSARIRVPSEEELAGWGNSHSLYPAYVFEAAAQGGLVLALKRISGQNTKLRLSLVHVAALSFSRNCTPGETLGLELRENAHGSPGMHCSAEIRDLSGRLVLVLHGMRFDET